MSSREYYVNGYGFSINDVPMSKKIEFSRIEFSNRITV